MLCFSKDAEFRILDVGTVPSFRPCLVSSEGSGSCVCVLWFSLQWWATVCKNTSTTFKPQSLIASAQSMHRVQSEFMYAYRWDKYTKLGVGGWVMVRFRGKLLWNNIWRFLWHVFRKCLACHNIGCVCHTLIGACGIPGQKPLNVLSIQTYTIGAS